MATFSLTTQLFPNGTSVGAYPAKGYSNFPAGGPPGSTTATATVTGAKLTFSGLTEEESYFAAAQVNGEWRSIFFTVGEDNPLIPVSSKALESGKFRNQKGEEFDATSQAETDAKFSGDTLKEASLPSSVGKSSDGSAFPAFKVSTLAARQVPVYSPLRATGQFAFKDPNFLDPADFGAIGDGSSHPLSERYATLAAAQADYPHATALTQEIDWAAIQGAYNALPAPTEETVAGFKQSVGGGGKVRLGHKHYMLGASSIEVTPNSNLDGDGAALHYSGTKDAIVRTSNAPYTLWRACGHGFTLKSTWSKSNPTGGRHAFNILRGSECVWGNVTVFGFESDGVVLAQAQWCDYSNVRVYNCGGYAFRVADGVELETELTEEVSAAAETLPVAATVNVETGKEARIGGYYGEEVTYAGRTAESLTGCTRGLHQSRARSWPKGTPVFIMAAQRSNNNYLPRAKGEGCYRGGIFLERAQDNCIRGTMQFNQHETTLAQKLTVPGELATRENIKLASTEGLAPSGWFVVDTEIITYERLSGNEAINCLRGMKNTTAVEHAEGKAVRQGVGVHCRGGDNFKTAFRGHLEGNLWHTFIEAWKPSTEEGLPRTTDIDAFFVASEKCERWIINQGDGTVLKFVSQADISSMLTRNSTKLPIETYQASGGGCNITILGGAKVSLPAEVLEKGLTTDQSGTALAEGFNGRGIHAGEALYLGRPANPAIYITLSNGAHRKILDLAGSKPAVRWGNSEKPSLFRQMAMEPLLIDSTGKTSKEISTKYEEAMGLEPQKGVRVRDAVNHLDLVYDGSKWFKQAGTEIA